VQAIRDGLGHGSVYGILVARPRRATMSVLESDGWLKPQRDREPDVRLDGARPTCLHGIDRRG